ncbi:MAG: ABC transporter permease [Gemmatimonadetes bacterium]|nr:ABC transporter permease [Gemmatimonadota bacterium]
MVRYVMGRLAQGVVVVFVVVTLTFILIHAAPGDPLTSLANEPNVRPEVVEQMRRNLGLDRPLHVQYVRYLGRMLRGDLGVSLTQHRSVAAAIRDAIPNTILLALAALLIDFGIGVSAGAFQGAHPRSRRDRTLTAVTITLYSIPVFWLGMVLLFLFGEQLYWFPVAGVTDPVTYPFRSGLGKVADRLHHLVLPALTLGLAGAGYTARQQRAAMIEAIGQDFVRTARAKGLRERLVVGRHALRNALLPTIALAGLAFPALLSGTVLVETVFSWPGLGRLAADAIGRRDYPIVTGAALVAAVLVVLGNLAADVATRIADPRTKPAS